MILFGNKKRKCAFQIVTLNGYSAYNNSAVIQSGLYSNSRVYEFIHYVVLLLDVHVCKMSLH